MQSIVVQIFDVFVQFKINFVNILKIDFQNKTVSWRWCGHPHSGVVWAFRVGRPVGSSHLVHPLACKFAVYLIRFPKYGWIPTTKNSFSKRTKTFSFLTIFTRTFQQNPNTTNFCLSAKNKPKMAALWFCYIYQNLIGNYYRFWLCIFL